MHEADRTWSDRAGLPVSPESPAEAEGSRPWGTRDRMQATVDFRRMDGRRRFFPYHNLRGAKLSGDTIIVLFEDAEVSLRGRHMIELYDRLAACHVTYVQERHVSEFEVEEGDPYVEQIVIVDRE